LAPQPQPVIDYTTLKFESKEYPQPSFSTPSPLTDYFPYIIDPTLFQSFSLSSYPQSFSVPSITTSYMSQEELTEIYNSIVAYPSNNALLTQTHYPLFPAFHNPASFLQLTNQAALVPTTKATFKPSLSCGLSADN
jgi:hypothetical protein